MITIIGVRFRTAGKIYYFDPAGRRIKTGDHVIVETARGIEYGYVVLGNREVEESKAVQPLKPVIRMATPEDEAVEAKNKEKEKAAFKVHLFLRIQLSRFRIGSDKGDFAVFNADGAAKCV